MFKEMFDPQSLVMVSIGMLPIIIGALIHNAVSKQPKTRERRLRIWLLWFIGAGIGFTGIMGFLWHALLPDQMATEIGFAPSFFQYEVAVANLAVGVLGITSLFVRRRDFWLAAILANAVWLWGDAVGHIYQYVAKDNTRPGNAGGPFLSDILLPALTIAIFVMWSRVAAREGESTEDSAGA